LQRITDHLTKYTVGVIGLCIGIVLLAAIVHLTTILLVPRQAHESIASSIEKSRLEKRKFHIINPELASNAKLLRGQDPHFELAICPFDLENGAISVLGGVSETLWTMGVFSNASQNIYSLNDRLLASENLEILIVNQFQLAELQEIGAQELEKRIVVPVKKIFSKP